MNEIPKENTSPTPPTPTKKDSFKDIARFTFFALLIVIPFRMFVAQPYVVSGLSMDPTFKNGDYLIVDQLTPRFQELSRGEVLIFKYPLDPSRSFIKRVIGLPGETVEIASGEVRIKNTENPVGFILDEPYVLYPKDSGLVVTLKDDEYFMMGDNRAGSLDSRSWGPLNRKFIIGHPVIRLLPISHIDILPGDHSTYEKTQKN